MKISINYKGNEVSLDTTMPLTDLYRNFTDIVHLLDREITKTKFDQDNDQQTIKIREFINSPKFTGIESLVKFFDELAMESKSQKVIPTLYAEIIDNESRFVIKRLKFTNINLEQLREGLNLDYITQTGASFSLSFNPSYDERQGVGIDNQTYSSITLLIADSLDKIRRYNSRFSIKNN